MLAAAMLVCLGHGSNDVANGISPLLVVMEEENKSEKGAYLLGSAGIALGLLLLGSRVMETVGKKVIKLDFAKGFSAQFATAMAVNIGTAIGMPLSTTHCMVGSLCGLILANYFDIVKDAYEQEEVKEENVEEDNQSSRQQEAVQASINEPTDREQQNQEAVQEP